MQLTQLTLMQLDATTDFVMKDPLSVLIVLEQTKVD
jgi:hypothetical protein